MEIRKEGNRHRRRITPIADGPVSASFSQHDGTLRLKCVDGSHDYVIELNIDEARKVAHVFEQWAEEHDAKRAKAVITRSFLK